MPQVWSMSCPARRWMHHWDLGALLPSQANTERSAMATTPTGKPTPEYVLGHDPAEIARLEQQAAVLAPAVPEMTVPALLLVPAAAEDTLSPSTTAETAAIQANLIPVICSPHSSALPTGGAGPARAPAIGLERICLLKYTSADIHVKRPRCAAANWYRPPETPGRFQQLGSRR